MARTNAPRLNLLGVVSLLIGLAAFVATKVPIGGYGAIPIALLGIGVGVLAVMASRVIRSWGSGMPVLGILVSAGALALAGYNNGTLPQWWAKMHPPPPPAPAVVAPPPAPPAPAVSNETHGTNSIFDTDRGIGSTPQAASPAKSISPSAPTIAEPASPSAPAIPQPLTISQARAKLDAATASVERSLSNDPAYVQAKADVAAADEKRKAALAESGPGSPQVQEASSQWLDARTRLKRLVDAAVAKDPIAQAAQNEMNGAQANVRAGKAGSGK